MIKNNFKFHKIQEQNLFLYNSKSFFFPIILRYLISLFIKEGRKSAGYKFIYKALLKLRYIFYSKPLSVWRFDANLLNNRAPLFYMLCMKQHFSSTYVPKHIKFKRKPHVNLIKSQLMSKKRFKIKPTFSRNLLIIQDLIITGFIYFSFLSKIKFNNKLISYIPTYKYSYNHLLTSQNDSFKGSFVKFVFCKQPIEYRNSFKYTLKTNNKSNFVIGHKITNLVQTISNFKSPQNHNLPVKVFNSKGIVYFIRQTVHKRTKAWWKNISKNSKLKSKFLSVVKSRYKRKTKIQIKHIHRKLRLIKKSRFNNRKSNKTLKRRPIKLFKRKFKKNEWFRFLSDIKKPDLMYNNRFFLNTENLSLEDSFVQSWDPDEDESEMFTHPEIINQRKMLRRPFFGIYVMKLYYNVSLSGLFNDLEDTFFPFEPYRGSKSYFNSPYKQMPFKVPEILYKGSARNISPPIDEAIYHFSPEYLNYKSFNNTIFENKIIKQNWPSWKKSAMFSVLTIIKEDISKLSLNKTNKPTPELVTNSIVLTVLNLLSKNHVAFKTLLQNRRVYTRQNLPFMDEDLFKVYF